MRDDVCKAYMTRIPAGFCDMGGHGVPKVWKRGH